MNAHWSPSLRGTLTTEAPPSLFDPELADEAEVRRVGDRWVLVVRRYTGDVLASAPLHVDGDFQARVLKLAARLLIRWNVACPPAEQWRQHGGAWTAPVRPRASGTPAPVKL
ncbi:MAG: hypothetical protein Q7T71_12515 [Herbiconiux sp.]|nr:hypothetical protein [Herbiconiux sp.]